MLEFTFVGIPMMFVLISIFEISRGMWVYHTLANSVKAGVRYAIVHGQDCGTNGNACQVQIKDIARKIQDAGVGLDTGDMKTLLTFNAGGTGNPPTFSATPVTCYLGADCLGNPTPWPPSTANQRGTLIAIDIVTPFRSALALFWPGARPANFSGFFFPASSSDTIQF